MLRSGEGGQDMQAKTGDRILVHGHRVGDPEREGVIIDVRGEDGAPPYVVKWNHDDGEHLFFPGTDAVIKKS